MVIVECDLNLNSISLRAINTNCKRNLEYIDINWHNLCWLDQQKKLYAISFREY